SLLVADVCRQCASRTAIRVPTHLFFSMLQPPPTSTLFPYTTLFRSTQRRIRNHTSIPVMLSVYLYSGKPWGQSPTGHHVARIDSMGRIIKINKITARDLHRTDTKTHLLTVDTIKINQALERTAQ